MDPLQILMIIWLVPIPIVFAFFLWADKKAQEPLPEDDNALRVEVDLPWGLNSEQSILIWYAVVAICWPLLIPGIMIKRNKPR